jgi:hypothetical protein
LAIAIFSPVALLRTFSAVEIPTPSSVTLIFGRALGTSGSGLSFSLSMGVVELGERALITAGHPRHERGIIVTSRCTRLGSAGRSHVHRHHDPFEQGRSTNVTDLSTTGNEPSRWPFKERMPLVQRIVICGLFVVSSAALFGGREPPDRVQAVEVRPALRAGSGAPLQREQSIDTDVEPRTRSAPRRPAREPHPAAPASTNRKVRTPADEDLPPWVPIEGRLTVVESSDLAENLGLVPMGSAKKSEVRISVAELLAQESAARAAASEARQ